MPRILFPPYNAIQIEEILQKRVGVGFNEDVFEGAVISKIAGVAAQEHGDIRKAMEPCGQSPWYLFGIPSYAKASEGYPPVAKSAEASIFQRTNDLATIYAFIHG